MREEALVVFERAAARDARGAKVLYSVGSRTNCQGLAPPSGSSRGDEATSRYFTDLANTLLAGQQWGSALEVYLTALGLDAGQARPYGAIGLVCQELGSVEVGMAYVQRGLELHPGDAELHYYRGSLEEYLGRPLAAIESYKNALELSDTKTVHSRYSLRLGLAQLAAGQPAQAEESFLAALELNPTFAEAHYRLGMLRLRDRHFAEAEGLFKRALDLDPSLHEAFYSWGLACIRGGQREKGQSILEAYRRKLALRDPGGGMQ